LVSWAERAETGCFPTKKNDLHAQRARGPPTRGFAPKGERAREETLAKKSYHGTGKPMGGNHKQRDESCERVWVSGGPKRLECVKKRERVDWNPVDSNERWAEDLGGPPRWSRKPPEKRGAFAG